MKTLLTALIVILATIGTGFAQDYSAEIVSMYHEVSSSIISIKMDAEHYRDIGRDFCNSKPKSQQHEWYLRYQWQEVYCDEVVDHFRTRYIRLVNVAYKLDGYCQEYLGWFVTNGECYDVALSNLGK